MQKEEEQHVNVNKEDLDSLLCPSFNCYSTDQLTNIAEQVTRDHIKAQNDDSDFEFTAFRNTVDDGGFFDGTGFPLFNRDLVTAHRSHGGIDSTAAAEAILTPMERLRIGGGEDRRSERESPSSEADELEGIPAGTYCVWTPNSAQAFPRRCKKSNSTGTTSSKRWKLLDLLRRSNSDGKESSVLPAKKKGSVGKQREQKVIVSAQEGLYMRRVEKRRSFLPYRQDLVGFCTSRLGKACPSF